jgi:hypothetical protein
VFGAKVELIPDADAVIKSEYPGLQGYVLGVLLANLSIEPRAALGDPEILRLILKDDIVRSPVIDKDKVLRLLTLPEYPYEGTYFDEQVEVHLLTPAEARVCSLRPCYPPE